MKRKFITGIFLAAFFTMCSTFSFAGTGKVKFGAYSGGGGGCGGTGICESGSGALVATDFQVSKDRSTTTFSISVQYSDAVANGFTGDSKGGKYTFTNGYPFGHPGDKTLGVPDGYQIASGYVCNYDAPDSKGYITLIVTQAAK